MNRPVRSVAALLLAVALAVPGIALPAVHAGSLPGGRATIASERHEAPVPGAHDHVLCLVYQSSPGMPAGPTATAWLEYPTTFEPMPAAATPHPTTPSTCLFARAPPLD